MAELTPNNHSSLLSAYRTHTNGELRLDAVGQQVTLSGWVQRVRLLGGVTFVDLRDRYGITQLTFDEGAGTPAALSDQARALSREDCIKITGPVKERHSKNANLPTGDIEVFVETLEVLSKSITPPFTIEDDTDGGEELRYKYRYLDIRRAPIREALMLRHKVAQATRNYLSDNGFIEVETPVLIKSTPEGARDFVVPSRQHAGSFYALPQSPQLFKQLLMVGGMDRYFQIVKCFRDEDLRADRQPEFTQIDCEMAFVEQEDVMKMFEGLIVHLFQTVKGVDLLGGDSQHNQLERLTYDEAMRRFGNDKPDMRFGMELADIAEYTQGADFKVFDDAESVIAIAVPGGATLTRKEIDGLTEWVKRPQIGATGLVYVKYEANGEFKGSVDKFYNTSHYAKWAEASGAKPGDLMLILAGPQGKTTKAASELRLEMGQRLGLRDPAKFKALWVTDFPMFEYDTENRRFVAIHHPFTRPISLNKYQIESALTDIENTKRQSDFYKSIEMVKRMTTDDGKPTFMSYFAQLASLVKEQFLKPDPEVDHYFLNRANNDTAAAYDLVLNGTELGGGSIRIHEQDLQEAVFKLLGFSEEQAREQFGFLLDAFQYGAPPHGGIAFGLDRLCALMMGTDSIRDVMAFPKNNQGRDTMLDAPSPLEGPQLAELGLVTSVTPEEKAD